MTFFELDKRPGRLGLVLAAASGLLMSAFLGCGEVRPPDSAGGQTVIETGYLSCTPATDASCAGAVCVDASGKDHCVPLPDACGGKLTCDCLAKTICAATTTCSDTATGLTCAAPDLECTPGDTFGADDGCNTCVCPPSGKKKDAACTTMGCLPPDTCTPGESFAADDGCNTCTCPDSGKKSEAACTEIGCVAPDTCTPGEGFPAGDGCNTCSCPDSGKKSEAICTLMACQWVPCDNKACGDICEVCNPSDPACNLPGTTTICNPKGECVGGTADTICQDTCTPGEGFPAGDGCNTCSCPDSGKKSEAICTLMACQWLPCEDKACGDVCEVCNPSDPACNLPGTTTICNPKGECVAGAADTLCQDTCTPGESFPADDGCNSCGCPPSGKKSEAACTEIACVSVACSDIPPLFPEPNRTCTADADCTVAYHQINCCGSQAAWGINKDGAAQFKSNEQICLVQYPDCGCAAFPPIADDGQSATNPELIVATCDAGLCASKVLSGCHDNTECDNFAWCAPAGTPIGCGICFQPDMANTCAADTDCGATEICVQSGVSDCLCSPAMLCKPGCQSNADCPEGKQCGADMHCGPVTCAGTADCTTNFACEGGTCKRMTCASDSECPGFCVTGACYSKLGGCMLPVP